MTLYLVLPDSERSRDCLAGQHADCWHTVGGGAGFHGWRFRAALRVCPCTCHADCPLTVAEPAEDVDLYRLCTCADHSAVLAAREEIEATKEQVRQALDAVRPMAAGQSREQIKTALVQELLNRNVDTIDANLDRWATQLDAVANEDGLKRTTSVLGAEARYYRDIWNSLKKNANRPGRSRPDR